MTCDEAYMIGYNDALRSRRPHSPIFYSLDYIDGYADASIARDLD